MLTVFICPLCCIKRRFHKYLYIWGEISWQAFQPFCRRNVSATKKSQGFEFVCLLNPRQPSIFPVCEKWKLHWLSWRKNFFHEISVITFNLLKSKILPLFLYFHLPFMIIVETTAVPIKSHLLDFLGMTIPLFQSNPSNCKKVQTSEDFADNSNIIQPELLTRQSQTWSNPLCGNLWIKLKTLPIYQESKFPTSYILLKLFVKC